MKNLIKKIIHNLSSDLLSKKYSIQKHPLGGHCYIASEALFHLLKDKHKKVKPYVIVFPNGRTHWFLKVNGKIIDPTAAQFKTIPYHLARACGFLTKTPSKRCKILLARI